MVDDTSNTRDEFHEVKATKEEKLDDDTDRENMIQNNKVGRKETDGSAHKKS